MAGRGGAGSGWARWRIHPRSWQLTSSGFRSCHFSGVIFVFCLILVCYAVCCDASHYRVNLFPNLATLVCTCSRSKQRLSPSNCVFHPTYVFPLCRDSSRDLCRVRQLPATNVPRDDSSRTCADTRLRKSTISIWIYLTLSRCPPRPDPLIDCRILTSPLSSPLPIGRLRLSTQPHYFLFSTLTATSALPPPPHTPSPTPPQDRHGVGLLGLAFHR